MKVLKPFCNQKGMSLVSVMIIGAVVLAAASAVVQWGVTSLKTVKQSNVSMVADQIKQTLTGLVISPVAWKITQSKNSSLFTTSLTASLGSNGTLPDTIDSRLALYEPNSSTPYYASNDNSAGFDQYGKPCDVTANGFSSSGGNDSCPYRYDVRLKSRVLVNGVYVDTISFKFTYNPLHNKAILNTTRYNFDLVRNFDQDSVETTCISLAGSYNTSSAKCDVQLTQEADCQGTSTYSGPDAHSSTGHCANRTIASYPTCPSYQGFQGLDENGRAICTSVQNSGGPAVNLSESTNR